MYKRKNKPGQKLYHLYELALEVTKAHPGLREEEQTTPFVKILEGHVGLEILL